MLFFVIHLFTCAYTVWVISPSCPRPHLHLLFQSEPVLLCFPVLLKSRNKQ
jgi:hypothetical protein